MSADPFAPLPLFAIPLFPTVIAGHEERKTALRAEILALRDQYPGVVRSNRNAWHSGEEFAKHRSEHVAWVLAKAHRFAKHALARYHADWATSELELGGAWANVLGPGGWNAPHHHAPCTWSGCYYVSVGAIATRKDDPGGWIEFLNPAPWMSQIGAAGNFLYAPKDGLMLIFPAALQHFVHPHPDAEPRISIAFNFNVVPKAR